MDTETKKLNHLRNAGVGQPEMLLQVARRQLCLAHSARLTDNKGSNFCESPWAELELLATRWTRTMRSGSNLKDSIPAREPGLLRVLGWACLAPQEKPGAPRLVPRLGSGVTSIVGDGQPHRSMGCDLAPAVAALTGTCATIFGTSPALGPPKRMPVHVAGRT